MEMKYNINMCVKMVMFIFMTLCLQQFGDSATLVVDGVSEWNNPTVQVGDSIIFRHKYNYNLYIFKNRRAFNLCNFTESTLLTPQSPTFTWHPSRLGSFYFAFRNTSTKACDDGQKLAIQVSSSLTPETSTSPPQPQPPMAASSPSPTISGGGKGTTIFASPQPSTTPGGVGDIISSIPPSSSSSGGFGGIISSSPSYPWPNRPQELTSPSPSPMNAIFPSNGPIPRKGSTLPFINSNPAVPLPTGEVDSATIRPAPTSSDHKLQDVGFVGVAKALYYVVLLVVLL
uniref:classical arabinogalactan protein 9 n=1 Tax=Erigeron canadensis TaxID=72917 RepID=UPI001CB8BDAA|nr:classical arabinogalactan protein 9 [Erigeron canadensis]